MATNSKILPMDEFAEESRAFDDAMWFQLQSEKSHSAARTSTPIAPDLATHTTTDISKTTANKQDQNEDNAEDSPLHLDIHKATSPVETTENDSIKASANTAQTPAPSVDTPPLYPIIINGKAPSKSSITLTKLEKLPILNGVIVRDKKKFKADIKRMSREEAWVATERGTIAEVSCRECAQGNNPFTICCVIEGMFKGACANCHYGGNSSRCSFHRDRQNAEAVLAAEEVEAPVIPGMAPAIYTGGSIAKGGCTLNGAAGAPLLQHIPIPQQFVATPGVVRGSKGQRLPPTPAPQFGFGSTDESRLAHARSLTQDDRKATALRLKAELAAMEKVMLEDDVEPKGTKRKQDKMIDE